MQSADEFRRLRLSQDVAEYHRAAHDDAPMEVWLQVIEKYPDLRHWVADNKTVPIEILEILARDTDWKVRVTVAGKRKLTEALLRQLSVDPYETVRAKVARHRKTPRDVLEQLAADPLPMVSDIARERLATESSAG